MMSRSVSGLRAVKVGQGTCRTSSATKLARQSVMHGGALLVPSQPLSPLPPALFSARGRLRSQNGSYLHSRTSFASPRRPGCQVKQSQHIVSCKAG